MKKISILLSVLLLISCANENEIEELTIYTSRQPQLLEPIIEDFYDDTGIKVNLLSGNAQELMERIDIEGNDSMADIFMTVDAGVLWQAAERDIFSKVDSEILERNVPSYLKDPENKWFGLSKRARTIVFSSDQFTSDDFSTYEDLADPKWKGKLCLRTSKKVYNRSLIASMIDEYPILAILASTAEGKTIMNGIKELRVKERDRIKAVSDGLRQNGIEIEESEDSLTVFGKPGSISGGSLVKTYYDHRIAMSFLCLDLVAKEPVRVDSLSSINTSFKEFLSSMKKIGAKFD